MSPDGLSRQVKRLLVDYLHKGPQFITSLLNPDETIICGGFKISQTTVVHGPFEELSVFVPSSDSRGKKQLPLIRQFSHDFALDRQKRHQFREPIIWPSVTVGLYSLTSQQMNILDTFVRQLEQMASSERINERGLDLASWYRPDDETVEPWLATEPISYRSVCLLSEPTLEITFYKDERTEDSEFRVAWQKAWNYMQSICTPAHLAHACQEDYDISPEDFARLLSRTL